MTLSEFAILAMNKFAAVYTPFRDNLEINLFPFYTQHAYVSEIHMVLKTLLAASMNGRFRIT